MSRIEIDSRIFVPGGRQKLTRSVVDVLTTSYNFVDNFAFPILMDRCMQFVKYLKLFVDPSVLVFMLYNKTTVILHEKDQRQNKN